jgi:RHS repeat-associated protein
VIFDTAYTPFGEAYALSGSADLYFTGENQDLNNDEYDFPYRQYHAAQGRWVSPDPAGQAAVDPTLPQSWNRYVYVSDNPLTSIDPLGLWLTQIGNCLYDTVGVYVDGEYQGTDTQFAGCFATLQPWLFNPPKTVGTGDGGGRSSKTSSTTANSGFLLAKIKSLLPSLCGGGGFGYGGVGGHAGPVHGEILGLVEYDSRLGGAHGGLVGGGLDIPLLRNFTAGVESMRTWSDWQTHTTPIALGGIDLPGASSFFGGTLNVQSRDIGGLAQYDNGNLSLGFYAGTTLGSGRALGGGGYVTLSWNGCGQGGN